jgi:cyclopropane fatty-acyl-phospholipid synthase-like methyltransferase
VSEDHRHTVESGYNQMAEQYLATKDPDDPLALAALGDLASLLPPGAAVLDLGCGAGVPGTRWLADEGFAVTGVDVSARQLELARRYVPAAAFVKADMTTLTFAPRIFDAVVAFNSIIHVSREDQPALLEGIHRWLKPGGLFLANWATSEWEGEEENWEGWGASMWWSHYGEEENLVMLREAGFEISSAKTETSRGTGDDEPWLWVLARKMSREGTA